VAGLASLISAFGSNTASAAIIVPILLSAAAQIDTSSSLLLVFAATFGASFGFLLPVSTPPNAIVYSTGSVSRNQLLRSGATLQAVGIVLVVLFVFVLYPLIGLL
jgi:sodium-dependent dicarboxylate transporter 2/3/5